MTLTPRLAFGAAIVLVSVAMAAALYLQHGLGFAPCPLCVLQRMGFVAAAVFAAGALFAGRAQRLRLVFGVLAILGAIAGGGVAVWHSFLVAYPPESMSCGRSFEWFHEDFPLGVWLPKLFRGDGDCFQVDWTLLGLNIPQWAAVMFVVLIVLLIAGIAATNKIRTR